MKFFAGARTNVCYNTLDRHIKQGSGDRPAFLWEGNEPGTDRRLTYKEALDQTCKLVSAPAPLRRHYRILGKHLFCCHPQATQHAGKLATRHYRITEKRSFCCRPQATQHAGKLATVCGGQEGRRRLHLHAPGARAAPCNAGLRPYRSGPQRHLWRVQQRSSGSARGGLQVRIEYKQPRCLCYVHRAIKFRSLDDRTHVFFECPIVFDSTGQM